MLLGAVGYRATHVTGMMNVAFRIAEITNDEIMIAVI